MRAKRGSYGLEVMIAIIILSLLGVAFIWFSSAFIVCRISGQASSASFARQITLAAIMYGADHDERMPLMINGPWRNLQNIPDDAKTSRGERRTDGWSLVLLPYMKSRALFVTPDVENPAQIWRAPALAVGEKGFDAKKNTYRNQSRFPMYGLNYQFLSPLRIPRSRLGDPDAMDSMVAESRSFNQCREPSDTIFMTESKLFDISARHGFFGINAPGMWARIASDASPYVAFWSGAPCSGDWCGDAKAAVESERKYRTNSVRLAFKEGSNYTFVDGHVAYQKATKAASGTDFMGAKPNDGGVPGSLGGGAVITDKTKYRWNLDDEFMPP